MKLDIKNKKSKVDMQSSNFKYKYFVVWKRFK